MEQSPGLPAGASACADTATAYGRCPALRSNLAPIKKGARRAPALVAHGVGVQESAGESTTAAASRVRAALEALRAFGSMGWPCRLGNQPVRNVRDTGTGPSDPI